MQIRLTQLVCTLFALISFGAHATAQRTFVASYGLAANTAFNCSIAKPCRAFGDAVSVTNAGGEVIVLDSAGYGSVTIAQSVSIIAPSGVYAGVSVLSGDGIVVNAPAAIVTLRGLTITGLGGTNGINVFNVGQLRIEGVHVSGFASIGFFGLLFAAVDGRLTVSRSVFEGNWIGIESEPPASTTLSVVVEDTILTQNTAGYRSNGPGTTNAVITRTNASANSENGFIVTGAATDTLVLEGCVASKNGYYGVASYDTVVLSNNTITSNLIGVYLLGGIIETRQNNTIRQNGSDVSGLLTNFPGN